ncbi:MAG: Fic family protein [Clostridia bacterium]|nr:Fic family protein [Clostridia bacterium]
MKDHPTEPTYKPPYALTEEITGLIANIAELTGLIAVGSTLRRNPTLRRENRIRTIYSSLAIEHNSLSLGQVTAVLDGKRVLAPPRDIHEVKNAYTVYEQLDRLNPCSMDDLLRAHALMMSGLVDEAGCFRSGGVGVYKGSELIHAGTPPKYIPEVMAQLFDWMQTSRAHPLIKSCVFHYEFEFIHPFADGNGRMGRLWHTLILSKWQPFFAWVPVESLIHDHQEGYYEALAVSDSRGESTVFIQFMLGIIREALTEVAETEEATSAAKNLTGNLTGNNLPDKFSDTEQEILRRLANDPMLTQEKLAAEIGKSLRTVRTAMKRLQAAGVLRREGARKNGKWIILEN